MKAAKQNGSGFFVSREILVTALHVVKTMNKEIGEYPEGYAQIYVERMADDLRLLFSARAQVVLIDEKNDLALLKVDVGPIDEFFNAKSVSILEVSKTAPDIGDEVVMSGFRGKEILPFTSIGSIALVSELENPTPDLPQQTVFANLTSLPGNSGAGIVSLKTGKIVGIQLGALNWDDTPTSMSYAASPVVLSNLVSKYLAN